MSLCLYPDTVHHFLCHWYHDQDPVQAKQCVVCEPTLWMDAMPACMCVILSIKQLTNVNYLKDSRRTKVAAHSDLLGKKPHRQVSMNRAIASGSLGSVMANALSLQSQAC